MTVVFRADASSQLGTGHVMRCLTLANYLRSQGREVLFICQELAGHLCDLIEAQGIQVLRLKTLSNVLEDAKETVALLDSVGSQVEWLVVDHYHLDERWEQIIRRKAKRIMVIDDLADRRHDCDLLLDQNLHADPTGRYATKVPRECKLLLGPRYALLRDEFTPYRSQPRDSSRVAQRVMIFYGIADAANLTTEAIELLQELDAPLEIDVVLGGSHPHEASVCRAAEGKPNVRIHRFVKDIAALMSEADLFIGAGGSSSWERSCIGLPSIVTAIAENQQELCENLSAAGCIIYLGAAKESNRARLLEATALLVSNQGLRNLLTSNSQRLVDGRGVQRAAMEMKAPPISIRRATAQDALLVFPWRNAEVTRRHSLDPSPIDLDAHTAWFNRALQSPHRLLLIGEASGTPFGVLRYDVDGDEALVSIYLDPSQQGRGLGRTLLEVGAGYLREHVPEVRKVIAEVLSSNEISRKTFEGAAFKLHKLVFQHPQHTEA